MPTEQPLSNQICNSAPEHRRAVHAGGVGRQGGAVLMVRFLNRRTGRTKRDEQTEVHGNSPGGWLFLLTGRQQHGVRARLMRVEAGLLAVLKQGEGHGA
jgi:hypothetical protein